jgi:predicted transcriptional regulator
MDNIRYGEDRICLYYPDVKERLNMIKSTMYSSIKQLLTKGLIAKANRAGCYYINPAIVFKGDRIMMVQQYIKDTVPNQYTLDTMQHDEIQDIPGNEG